MSPLSELKTGDKIITSRGDVYVVARLAQPSPFSDNPRFNLGCDRHFGSNTIRFWSGETWSIEQLESIGAKRLDNEPAP